MKRKGTWQAVVLGLFVLAACDLYTGDILTSTTQTQTNEPPGASPSPGGGPAGPCPATATVNVTIKGGGSTTLTVGDVVTLDATPRHSAGPLPDACNEGKTVAWSVVGPCNLGGTTTGFNPELRGAAPGTCSVTAVVDNVTGGPLDLRVVE